jgi:hypothetical protein
MVEFDGRRRIQDGELEMIQFTFSVKNHQAIVKTAVSTLEAQLRDPFSTFLNHGQYQGLWLYRAVAAL